MSGKSNEVQCITTTKWGPCQSICNWVWSVIFGLSWNVRIGTSGTMFDNVVDPYMSIHDHKRPSTCSKSDGQTRKPRFRRSRDVQICPSTSSVEGSFPRSVPRSPPRSARHHHLCCGLCGGCTQLDAHGGLSDGWGGRRCAVEGDETTSHLTG